MTRYDQQILFSALAFVAVALKSNDISNDLLIGRAKLLASSLNSFCDQNVHSLSAIQNSAFASKQTETELDALIDRHLTDLREREETVLPPDSETLMKMYVRLQFRKIVRQNEVLFSMTTPIDMQDFVHSQLDGEIEDRAGGA